MGYVGRRLLAVGGVLVWVLNRHQDLWFKLILNSDKINSQAPVAPELATRGIFRLSRLSVSSYSKTMEKILNTGTALFQFYFLCKDLFSLKRGVSQLNFRKSGNRKKKTCG